MREPCIVMSTVVVMCHVHLCFCYNTISPNRCQDEFCPDEFCLIRVQGRAQHLCKEKPASAERCPGLIGRVFLKS